MMPFKPWLSSTQEESVSRLFGSKGTWLVLYGEYLPVTDFVMDFVTDCVGIGLVIDLTVPVFGKEGKATGICLVVPLTTPVSCFGGTYGLMAAETAVQARFAISCPNGGCDIVGTLPVVAFGTVFVGVVSNASERI